MPNCSGGKRFSAYWWRWCLFPSIGSTGWPKGVIVTHKNIMASWLPKPFVRSRMILAWHGLSRHGINWLSFTDRLCGCYVMSPLDFIRKPLKWLQVKKASRSVVGQTLLMSCAYLWWGRCSAWSESRSCNGAEPIKAHVMQRFMEKFNRNWSWILSCHVMAWQKSRQWCNRSSECHFTWSWQIHLVEISQDQNAVQVVSCGLHTSIAVSSIHILIKK